MNIGGKNTIRLIDQVVMAVSVDPKDQTEGLCAVMVGSNWVPLIAADAKRDGFVREQAVILAAQTGMVIKIIRLTTREEIETINPRN